jgi:AcrR family transcriptional regulator
MGVAERRIREKEELRQRILDAATDLFIHEGFENVSIRKIAEKIEYSPTTIYLHFKDKAELIGSICVEVFQGLERALDEIAARNLPDIEALRESLIRYIEFGLEHRNHYIVIFCLPEPIEYTEHRAEDPSDMPGMACFDKLRTCVSQCMDSGSLRPADVEAVSQSIFMMIHGVTGALLTMKSFPWVEHEALIRTSVNTIIRGLAGNN